MVSKENKTVSSWRNFAILLARMSGGWSQMREGCCTMVLFSTFSHRSSWGINGNKKLLFKLKNKKVYYFFQWNAFSIFFCIWKISFWIFFLRHKPSQPKKKKDKESCKFFSEMVQNVIPKSCKFLKKMNIYCRRKRHNLHFNLTTMWVLILSLWANPRYDNISKICSNAHRQCTYDLCFLQKKQCLGQELEVVCGETVVLKTSWSPLGPRFSFNLGDLHWGGSGAGPPMP